MVHFREKKLNLRSEVLIADLASVDAMTVNDEPLRGDERKCSYRCFLAQKISLSRFISALLQNAPRTRALPTEAVALLMQRGEEQLQRIEEQLQRLEERQQRTEEQRQRLEERQQQTEEQLQRIEERQQRTEDDVTLLMRAQLVLFGGQLGHVLARHAFGDEVIRVSLPPPSSDSSFQPGAGDSSG